MRSVMQGAAHEGVKLPCAGRIGNHRQRNVDTTNQVDFMRVLNVMDDKRTRVEPAFFVAVIRRRYRSNGPQEKAQGQGFGHAPLETGEEGNHNRVRRIWVRR